jgi:uncharacterized protein (TIGR02266 family)
MSDVSHDDRRAAQRVRVNCRCWVERESVTLLGTATNLSCGGLFMRTPLLLTTGSAVDIKLNLERGVVRALGRVVWTQAFAGGEQASPGMGISFEEVRCGTDLLHDYVAANFTKAP